MTIGRSRSDKPSRLVRSGACLSAVTALGLGSTSSGASSQNSGRLNPATSCHVSHFEARQASSGSEASQPFVIIALVNHGPRCSIDGYPKVISASGRTQQARTESLPIKVIDGPDYEHPDPGPHRLTLVRGATASFALGTGTAYGGGAHLYTILSLSIALPGKSSSSAIRVPVQTNVSAQSGVPFRLEVTAFVIGSRGPPAG